METLQNMYEHLHWANLRILETLKMIKGDSDSKQVINLFSHILFAEQVWATRIKGEDSSTLPIWAEVDLDTCTKLVELNNNNFTQLLSEIDDDSLDEIISYSNSKGTEFHNSIRDILTHVALHGQYHRGQINLRLRADEFEPVNVDFITFKRSL
ncbi:DinB family protein [Neobacillus sp. K501]|jgi:uncharacterized damage-inducible protein DinB